VANYLAEIGELFRTAFKLTSRPNIQTCAASACEKMRNPSVNWRIKWQAFWRENWQFLAELFINELFLGYLLYILRKWCTSLP
jgi:hypothetical protein